MNFDHVTKKKKTEKQRSYNISVVGFSGPVELENKKDATDSIIDGIGKSSFCARFTQPHQDEYKAVDKRSIISPIDFGSKLINNRNTLWWGTTSSSGQTFSLLEHTVFLDDSRLEPFESRNSKTDKYESRCAETTFKNWMQKQFFGFSNQQDNDSTEMIPERFKIDAFLVLIDVSKERMEKQELQRQLDFVARIVKNIKLKSYPVVLGLTKFDLIGQQTATDLLVQSESEAVDSQSELVKEDKIVRRIRDYFRQHELGKKLTKRELHIVETSAERNINIKETFKLLAHLIDKIKGKATKTVEVKSYREQSKEVDKFESDVYSDLSSLLKDELIRYEVTWEVEKTRLAKFDQFEKFKQIFGTDLAKKAFKERLKNLKNLYKGTIVQGYRIYIEMALNAIITSPAQLRNTWDELMEQVEKAVNFGDWFIKLDGYDQQGYNYEKRQFWIEDEHVSSLTDKRIPFHLLRMKLPDSDTAGHNFRHELLKRLNARFVSKEPTDNCDDSFDTSLNDSIDFLDSESAGSPPMLHRASSARIIDKIIPRAKLKTDRFDSNGKWSWSGGENLKVILLGSDGLTKELASEIQNDCSESSDDTDENTQLEVIKIEEPYSEPIITELLKRKPHGCIAVYSNRETFDYCHTWLTKSILEHGDFKGLPVSILMASDRDLDDFDRDELIKSGKDLVAELSPNSTGRFIAPLGGSYLDMKRIHQSQIKQGLQSFVDELKKVAGYQKPIIIGCGSSRLDRQSIDRLQSYLIHAGCTLDNDKLIFKSKYHFMFFDVSDERPIDYDAIILAFSQPNGQNECYQYVRQNLNSSKVQFLIGQSDRADALKRVTEEKFPTLTESHPVLMGPLTQCGSLVQLERIIISAQAQRDTKSLDDSMSTFDLNSNIESSLGDDDSVDSGRIKSIRDKFESTHDFTKPKKVPLGSSVNRLDQSRLDNLKLDPTRISGRKSLPSITNEIIEHDQNVSITEHSYKSSGLLSHLISKGTSSKHSTGSSDSDKPRKTPKPAKRNSFRGKLRRDDKTGDEYGSNESLDQLGLSVDRAVDLNNTLNSTLDQPTPRQTPHSESQPKEKTRKQRPWTRKTRTDKPPHQGDISLISQNGDEWLETSRFFKKPLQRDFTLDVDRTSLLYPGLVPAFIRDIVERLEDMGGLDTEGLYRVPADRKKRQELLKCFDANYKPNGVPVIYDHLNPAPNTLAGCIQWYISPKNLPEPIIPKKFLKRLHDAMKPENSDASKITRLRDTFTELGAEKVAHWQTIKYLCQHFYRVTELSHTNQMHAKNIATCLFPTFFSDIFAGQFTAETFTLDSGIYIDILVLLIEKHDEIFVNDVEVVKSVKLRNAREAESMTITHS